jgi:hypothetical protein
MLTVRNVPNGRISQYVNSINGAQCAKWPGFAGQGHGNSESGTNVPVS